MNEQELRKFLKSHKFMMFNRINRYNGEITTLDEKDIDNIFYDLTLGNLAPVVNHKLDGTLVIQYPDNVCRLVSVPNTDWTSLDPSERLRESITYNGQPLIPNITPLDSRKYPLITIKCGCQFIDNTCIEMCEEHVKDMEGR